MHQGLADLGVTRARAEVIWRLKRTGPVTQRALSEMLNVTPRNVTGLIDATESDGLVLRQPHPTDRRATLVRLTPEGESVARKMSNGYERLATELFGDLSAEQLENVVEALDLLLTKLRQGAGSRDQWERRDTD